MIAALAERVRQKGSELGFAMVGYSPAARAPRAAAFRDWLGRGFAGEMRYMAERPEHREDVTLRSPWARTVVSAAIHYGTASRPGPRDGPGISGLVSRYALGEDYHRVLKERLGLLARFLKDEAGGRIEARVLVDTSAILERDHAARAGIGWTGKNAMMIDPHAGSWFFLGEILTEAAIDPDAPMEDMCGTCARCIEACPTAAIVAPHVVDASRCISYLNIELRGAAGREHRTAIGDRLFGCDVCQEVCPWNRLAPPETDPAFGPAEAVETISLADTVRLDTPTFAARFRRTALARAGRGGLVRNALVVAANVAHEEALEAGAEAVGDPDPGVRETAIWALGKGGSKLKQIAVRAAEREPDPALRAAMRAALEG